MTCADCIRELSGRFKLLTGSAFGERDHAELEFVLMQTFLNTQSVVCQCNRCLGDLRHILPIAWAALQDGNQDVLEEHISSMGYELDIIITRHGEAV